MTATGVTSDSLNILGQTTANVYVGNESHYQRFYVADNISHEVILGTDFLSKLGEVAYNFQDCTFRFRNSSIPMGHSFYTDSVSVISSVKIPPLSEVVIVANVTTTSLHGNYCIFEGTNRHVNEHAQNSNMYTRNHIRTDASPVRVPSSASRRSDARSDVIRSQHSSSSEVRPRDTTRYALRRRPQRKRDPVYTS